MLNIRLSRRDGFSIEEDYFMYAIVECGGKQYKAEKDAVIDVDKMAAKAGDKVSLKVLMISDGAKVLTKPGELKSAKVTAVVLEEFKDKKVVVFKFKPKIHIRKKQGHRQPYTKLKIESIVI